MTILNESGVPDVLPPLHAAGGLAERLPNALVVVVGTRAEAHLAQSFRAPGTGPAGRVAFLILDPGEKPRQGLLASRVVEAAAGPGLRGTEVVLLVAGRSAALLGVDAAFEARLVARRLDVAAAAVDPDAPYDAPGVLCTDLEDRALAALVRLSPRPRTPDSVRAPGAERRAEPRSKAQAKPQAKPQTKRGGLLGGFLSRDRDEEGSAPSAGRPVVLLGASSPPWSARELAAELSRAKVRVAGVVPGGEASGTAGVAASPAVGEGVVVAAVDPCQAAVRAAEGRGARVVRTLAPIGVDGTARFVQDVAAAAEVGSNEQVRARAAWTELEPLRNRIRGKRIFFAGDTGFEVPLARFLADAGAVVLEVGAPRLDRRFLAAELQALGDGVDVVESPDRWGQMDRVDEARPDVVIASPGLYAPLVARGHLCRSAHDFIEAGPHGYGGARRVLELLTSTFERAAALDSLSL